jgi:hypothetical protein
MILTNPLRLQIQKNLSDLLRTISPANGYVFDFSGAEDSDDNRVFRGRSIFGDGDPVPMISILESPIPLDQLPVPDGSGFGQGGWELVLQGFVDDDKNNPTDPAHVALADVRKCLAIEAKKLSLMDDDNSFLGLPRIITGVNIGTGVVRPPDEVSAKAYFWLLIVLELVEDITDPYEV